MLIPLILFFFSNTTTGTGYPTARLTIFLEISGNLLWIATWDGLNMFDGNTFHVFNYSKENDFKSIGSNVIQQITEDHQGNIWASTIEGISRYEKKTGKFYNYFYDRYHRNRVSELEYALAVDMKGNVYCLNQKTGLNYYDAEIDSFLICKLPGQKSAIGKLLFDEVYPLWLLNADGQLNVYAVNQHQFTKLNSFTETDAITDFFYVNHQVLFSTASNLLYSVQKDAKQRKLIMQLKHTISSFIFYKEHYLAHIVLKRI